MLVITLRHLLFFQQKGGKMFVHKMSFLNFAVVQFQKAEAKINTKRPFRVAIGFSMMIKLTDE